MTYANFWKAIFRKYTQCMNVHKLSHEYNVIFAVINILKDQLNLILTKNIRMYENREIDFI